MTQQVRLGLGDVIASRFRLVAEIGEGGMGRVFEAADARYDRPAAVKLISRRLAQDPEFRARFVREAEAAQHANHPHILPVWDHGTDRGYLYLACPLCDADLGGLIEEHGELDLGMTLAVISQIAWALDWAHGRDVVHRDVKPENILVVAGPQHPHAYLADFGMAWVARAATLTQLGRVAGLSPAYAAPEQWVGERAVPATDQYALAGTLYCALAGRPPFWPRRDDHELRAAHLAASPPALEGRYAELAPVLARAMARTPEERYGSCQEFVTAARAALDPVTAPPEARLRAETDPEHPWAAGRSSSTADGPLGETVADQPGATTSLAPAPGRPTAATADDEPARSESSTQGEEPPAGDAGRTAVRRRTWWIAAGVAALLIVATAIVVAVSAGGGTSAGGSAQRAELTVGRGPSDLALGADGSLWTANEGDGTVSRIDTGSTRVVDRRLAALPSASQIAVGDGRVWVVSALGQARELDERTGRPVGRTVPLDVDAYDVAEGDGALWIADGTTGGVVRADARGDAALRLGRAPILGGGASSVAVGPDATWAVSPTTGHLGRFDTRTGTLDAKWHVGRGATAVVLVDGLLWVANPGAGRVMRFTPDTLRTAAHDAEPDFAVRVPRARSAALVGDARDVAYVDLSNGATTVIDGPTGARRTLPTPHVSASAAALAANRLWLAGADANTVTAIPVPPEGGNR